MKNDLAQEADRLISVDVDLIEGPDRHHLRAAEGWVELGNATEAAAEWAQLSAAIRGHPGAIEIRWRIEAKQGRWQDALETAQTLLRISVKHPVGWIHRAYALHELHRTQEAFDSLKPAAKRFPKETTIAYNLACYACQMGQLDVSRRWLKEAVRRKSAAAIQRIALADTDLELLWTEIAAW